MQICVSGRNLGREKFALERGEALGRIVQGAENKKADAKRL